MALCSPFHIIVSWLVNKFRQFGSQNPLETQERIYHPLAYFFKHLWVIVDRAWSIQHDTASPLIVQLSPIKLMAKRGLYCILVIE